MLWAWSFPSPRGIRRSEYKGCQARQAAVERQSRKRSIRWVVFPYRWSRVSAKPLQLCPSLCTPMDCSPPGFSVHGVLQARTLAGAAIPTQGQNPGLLLCQQILYHLSHHGSLRVAAGKTISVKNQIRVLSLWSMVSPLNYRNSAVLSVSSHRP